MKKWFATAPSNIALVKYMGKTDTASNKPTNTSLSYTLPHLLSLVEIEEAPHAIEDRWEPLTEWDGKKFAAIELSAKGSARFLKHLALIKTKLNYTGNFVVRSTNDFPSDCGLASSASSFAALTKGAVKAICDLSKRELPSDVEMADLSRQGSGSSCRSFFEPWSVWTAEGATGVELLSGTPELLHQVIVVDDEKKQVSSSEAHVRVTTSLLFEGRPERAEKRVEQLITALRADDWREAFEITWAEFWDMHALFETSRPSFGYMTMGSLEVLKWVRAESWDKNLRGPIMTMDAGANIHLLYKREDAALAQKIEDQFASQYKVFSSTGLKS